MGIKIIKNSLTKEIDGKAISNILIKRPSELKPPSQKDLYFITVLTQNIHPDDLIRLITDIVPAPEPTPPAETPEDVPAEPTAPEAPPAAAPEDVPPTPIAEAEESTGGEINAIGHSMVELFSGLENIRFAEASPHDWSAPFGINLDIPPLFPGPEINFGPFEVEFVAEIRDIIVGLPLEAVEEAPTQPPVVPNQPPEDDGENLTEDGEEEGCIEESLGTVSPISLFPSLLANSSDSDLGPNPTLEQLQAELDVVGITNVRFVHPTGGSNFGTTLEGSELDGLEGFDHLRVFFDPAFPDNTVIIIQGYLDPDEFSATTPLRITIDPLTGNLVYHNPADLWETLDFGESIAIAFDYQVQDSGGLQSDVSTARIEFCGEEELPPEPENDCFIFQVSPADTSSSPPALLSVEKSYSDLLLNDFDPNGDPLEVIAINGEPIPIGSAEETFVTAGWTVTLTSTGFTYSRIIEDLNGNGPLDEDDFDPMDNPISVLNDVLTYTVADPFGLTSDAEIHFNLPPTAVPDLITIGAVGTGTPEEGFLWTWSIEFTLGELMNGFFSMLNEEPQPDFDLNILAGSTLDVLEILSFTINPPGAEDEQEIDIGDFIQNQPVPLENSNPNINSFLTYLDGTTFRYSGTATTDSSDPIFENELEISYTLSDGGGDLPEDCVANDTTTVQFHVSGVVVPEELCIEIADVPLGDFEEKFELSPVFDQSAQVYGSDARLDATVCCDMDADIDKSEADTGTSQQNNIIFALSDHNTVNTGQGDNFVFATGCCWLEDTFLKNPNFNAEQMTQAFLDTVFNSQELSFLHLVSELECCEEVTNTVLSGEGQDMLVAIGEVNFVVSDIKDFTLGFDPENPDDLSNINWLCECPSTDTAIVQGENNQVLLGGGANSALIIGCCEVSDRYDADFEQYFLEGLNGDGHNFSTLVNVALDVGCCDEGISEYVGGLGANQVAMLSAVNFLQVSSFNGTEVDWDDGGDNQILMIASISNIANVGGAEDAFNTVIALGCCSDPEEGGMDIAETEVNLASFGRVQNGVTGQQVLDLLRQSCCDSGVTDIEMSNIITTGLSHDSILAVGKTNNITSDFDGEDALFDTAGNDDILAFGDNNIINAGGGNNRVIALGCCDELDLGFITDVLEYFSLEFDAPSGSRGFNNEQVLDLALGTLHETCAADQNTINTGDEDDDVLSIAARHDITTRDGDDWVNLKYLDDENAGSTVITGDGDDIVESRGLGDDEIMTGEGNDQVLAGDGNDFIDGGDDNDRLIGQGGEDTIIGGDGDDFINGGIGNDNLFGEEGADIIIGGDGDDFIEGGSGNDEISGGEGDDDLFGEDGEDLIDGGTGVDLIDAGDDDDTVVFDKNDAVMGNTVDGGADCDTLLIQADTEVNMVEIQDNSEGTFQNFELIDMENSVNNNLILDAATVISLTDENDVLAIKGDASDIVELTGDGWEFSCEEIDVDSCVEEHLTSFVVFFHRTNGGIDATVIIDADIANIIVGGFTQSLITVGTGAVQGTADDPLVGTIGDDIILGTSGPDHIFGDVKDKLTGGTAGNDHICGGAGDDTISGDAGSLAGSAQGGNDEIEGGAGRDKLYGDAITDITGNATGGDDHITGGDGDDFIVGDAGEKQAGGESALGGHDLLEGEAGNDTVIGDTGISQSGSNFGGDDEIEGGAGSDLLIGDVRENQNGTVTGGDDTLDGGADNDVLIGDVLDNNQNGNVTGGSDALTGGAGNDILDGGENGGIDTAFYSGDVLTAAARDFIDANDDDSEGAQTALVTAITATNLTFDEVLKAILGYQFSLGSKMLTGVGFGGESFTRNGILVTDLDADNGDDGEDLIVATLIQDLQHPLGITTRSSIEKINFFEGHEYGLINGVQATVSSETISGTSGNDILIGGATPTFGGNYTLNGNAGADLLKGGVNTSAQYTLNGGDDNDVLIGGDSSGSGVAFYHLQGGAGNDILFGGKNSGAAQAKYFLEGGAGNDILIAGENSGSFYELIGGDGNDTLIDGVGNHTLTGGPGNDTFVFDLEQDNGDNIVTDFDLKVPSSDTSFDTLLITGVTDGSDTDTTIDLDDLQEFINAHNGSITDTGGNVILDLGTDGITDFGSITFIGTGNGMIDTVAEMQTAGFQITVSG